MASVRGAILGDDPTRMQARILVLRRRVEGYESRTSRRLLRRMLRGSREARADVWSLLRAARYRFAHHVVDELRWLDRDLSVLPHWIADLDSNCCRISDGLDHFLFEEGLGLPHLSGTESRGVGQPPSRRATTWLELMGGDYVWSDITEAFVRRPE